MKKFIVFSLAFLIMGCGGSHSSDNNTIVGTWKSSTCEYIGWSPSDVDDEWHWPEFGDTKSSQIEDRYTIDRYEFRSDGTFHQVSYYYTNSTCDDGNGYIATYDGDYIIHESVVTTTGETAKTIELTIQYPDDITIERVYYIENETLYFGLKVNNEYQLKLDQPLLKSE